MGLQCLTALQGIAFCEYTDPATTDIAVGGLDGMEVVEQTLKVKRASIGVQQVSGLEMGVNAMSMLAGTTATDLQEGRVIQLLNMVTADELIDNDEYQGQWAPLSVCVPANMRVYRNLRGCQGRVRKVWQSHRSQGTSTQRGAYQPRCRQDLREIRGFGLSAESVTGSRGPQVLRPNCRRHLLWRGMFWIHLRPSDMRRS
jgi:hypothetical protein